MNRRRYCPSENIIKGFFLGLSADINKANDINVIDI